MNKDKIMRQIRVNAKLAKRKVKDVFFKVKQKVVNFLDSQIVIELQEDEFVVKEAEHKCNCGCGCNDCHCHEEGHECGCYHCNEEKGE